MLSLAEKRQLSFCRNRRNNPTASSPRTTTINFQFSRWVASRAASLTGFSQSRIMADDLNQIATSIEKRLWIGDKRSQWRRDRQCALLSPYEVHRRIGRGPLLFL
jgi:hypothetical protein